MKKMLSMILCVALVLSLGIAAFAAEADETVGLGDNTVVTGAAYTSVYRYFIPEEAGTYVITNTGDNNGLYVHRDYFEPWGYESVAMGSSMEVELAANEELMLEAYHGDANVTVTFNIALKEGGSEGGEEEEPEQETNAEPQVGENYMHIEYFDEANGLYILETTFTAPNAATYIFTMDSSNGFLEDSENAYYYEKSVALEAGEEYAFIINSWYEYASFHIEEVVIGDTNEEPQLGSNNIPSDGSWDEVYFTPDETGLYKFTNDHVGDSYSNPYLYLYSFNGQYPSEAYVYAGMSSYIELVAGEAYKFELKGSPVVKFTIDLVDPDSVEPDGSQVFPYVLVDGDNEVEMGDRSTVYFTYTAEVDGLLKLEGTLTNGSATAEGMLCIEEEVWAMNVKAGEKVLIEIETEDEELYLEATFTEGHQAIGTEEYPIPLPTEYLNCFLNNDYGYHYYTFTPDDDGVLTLSGEWGTADIKINGSSVTPDADGNVAKQLRANEEVVICFYVTYYEDDPVVLDLGVTFEARELQPDGSSDYPYEIVPGDSFTKAFNGNSYEYTYYTFTATEGGYLYLATGLTGNDLSNLTIGGFKKDGETGIASKYVEAGETIKFYMYSYGTYEVTFEVTFTPGEIVTDGTSDNPHKLAIGEIDVVLSAEDSYDGVYYKFVAEKDGVLTIVKPAEGLYIYGGGFSYTSDKTVYTLNMVAGQSVQFNVFGDTNVAVDATMVVSFVGEGDDEGGNDDGNDGPVVDPGDDVPTAGDYTFLVFALMVMSMTAIVVLVSKKRNF